MNARPWSRVRPQPQPSAIPSLRHPPPHCDTYVTAKLTWHTELSVDLGRIRPSMPSPCHRQKLSNKRERSAHDRSYWIAGKHGAHETLRAWRATTAGTMRPIPKLETGHLHIRPCVTGSPSVCGSDSHSSRDRCMGPRSAAGLLKAPRSLGRFQPCYIQRFPSLVMTLPFTCSMLCPAAHMLPFEAGRLAPPRSISSPLMVPRLDQTGLWDRGRGHQRTVEVRLRAAR